MQHESHAAVYTCVNITTLIEFSLNQLKSNYMGAHGEVKAALRRFCRFYVHFATFPLPLTIVSGANVVVNFFSILIIHSLLFLLA